MFDADYRRGMEALGPSDAQMEQMLTALEGAEEKAVKAPGKTLKMILLAAALCGALAATALAVSPTLRESLLAALGAFAPYRQETEGLCVVDQDIELKVVSTLCDGNSAKVYLELRDLTGDRLDEFTQCDLDIMPANWGEEGDVRWSDIGGGGEVIRYDPTSKIVLAETELFGLGPPAEKLTLKLYMTEIRPGGARDDAPKPPAIRGQWDLTVEAEMVERLSIDMLPSQTVIAGVTARTLHLSALGATLESDANGTPNGLGYPLTVYLSDGRVLPPIKDPPMSLASSFCDDTVSRWPFSEPVEPREVVATPSASGASPLRMGPPNPATGYPRFLRPPTDPLAIFRAFRYNREDLSAEGNFPQTPSEEV